MKEHPVISEYILPEVDLDPIVLQIARSSHERMDGKGYPDGKRGRRDPAAGADRARRGRLRRADERPPVPLGPHGRAPRWRSCAPMPARQFCPKVIAALEALYREQPGVLGAAARCARSAKPPA